MWWWSDEFDSGEFGGGGREVPQDPTGLKPSSAERCQPERGDAPIVRPSGPVDAAVVAFARMCRPTDDKADSGPGVDDALNPPDPAGPRSEECELQKAAVPDT